MLWWQRERGEVTEVPEEQFLEMYRILVQSLQRAGYEQEELTQMERYDERVMFGLRTACGVDADKLRKDFGNEAWRHFVKMAQGHITAGNLSVSDDGRYVLTRDGIMLSDTVIRDLMWDE